MDYSQIIRVVEILENDINDCLAKITATEDIINQMIKYKKSLFRISKEPDSISSNTLTELQNLSNMYDLNIEVDLEEYSHIIGPYYVNPTEKNKKLVNELLYIFHSRLERKRLNLQDNIKSINDLMASYSQIKDYLSNLLDLNDEDYNMAISSETVLNALLSYIYHIDEQVMSDEDRTKAIYQFNLINYEALRRRENLVNDNHDSNDMDTKPYSKVKFESDNAIFFEEINNIIDRYNRMLDNLTTPVLNQMESVSQEHSLDIITDQKVKDIEEYLKVIGATFSSDFYIRFYFFEKISEWYDFYLNCNNEKDFKDIIQEIQKLVAQYNDYVNNISQAREIGEENTVAHELIFLDDENQQFVGIDQINSDTHEYQAQTYNDLFKGFNILRTADRDFIINETLKVKEAGIPGVPEGKFRRLRVNTARLVFIDLNNLIEDKYKQYLNEATPCFLVINFGRKNGEGDIYKAVGEPRIINLLVKYRASLNNSLESIYSSNVSEEEKSYLTKTFFEQLVIDNNDRFKEAIKDAKGYETANEKGGLKYA